MLNAKRFTGVLLSGTWLVVLKVIYLLPGCVIEVESLAQSTTSESRQITTRRRDKG
jgi:hypothetical protein